MFVGRKTLRIIHVVLKNTRTCHWFSVDFIQMHFFPRISDCFIGYFRASSSESSFDRNQPHDCSLRTHKLNWPEFSS